MADTTSRYAVYVPDPKTRLNLGKPEGGDSEFGYKGASLQASENLFIDISKNTLMQTGAATYLTSGGAWTQTATGAMTVVSKSNTMWAASGKVLLAAGAGGGQSKVGATGDQPSGSPYNNLSLHYKVETVQNMLKNLFFGKDYATEAKVPHATQLDWVKTGKYPAKSLLGEISTLLDELGYPPDEHEDLHKQLLQQLEWTGDNLTSNQMATSNYGVLNSFDPYFTSSYTKNILTKVLARILQVGVFLRRLADVLNALVASITNMETIKRIKYFARVVHNFTGLIAKTNPDEWVKLGEKMVGGWESAWGNWEKKAAAWGDIYSDESTAAELLGAAEMYDLTQLQTDELELKLDDGSGDKILDLSPYLNDQPAVHIIDIGADFGGITVAKSGDGTLTLGGTKLTWSSAQSKWLDDDAKETELPESFVEESGIIKMKGGGLFKPEVSGGITFTDATFSGQKLDVDIDGSINTVATDSINAGTTLSEANLKTAKIADERAANAAGVIGGAGAISASASGKQVTIETTKTGKDASIALIAKLGEHITLGFSGSATGTGGGEMSAGQLAQLINGSGANAIASVVNGAVKVKHNVTGNSSYLKFHGKPAQTTFGTDPREARGTEASAWDRVAEFDNMVSYAESWPGTLGKFMGPVVTGIRALSGVWSKIEGAAKNIKFLLLGKAMKEAIGMISGDGGFTVGTSGNIYQAGKTVTLIAGGKGPGVPVDLRRFVPLAEPAMKKFKYYESFLWKLMKEKLEPKHSPDKQGLSGFRIVSDGDVQTIARRHVRTVAAEGFEVYAKSAYVVAQNRVTISARKAGLKLEGLHVQIGTEKSRDAQDPTETITLESVMAVGVTTESMFGWWNEAKKEIFMGTRDANVPLGRDHKKPHLLVTDSKVAIGNLDGANRRGVIVEGGDVTIDASSSAKIGAGGMTGVEVSASGVSVSGKFEVGTALTVNGAPVSMAPLIEPPELGDPSAVAVLKTKYAACVALATGVNTAIAALDRSIMIAEMMILRGGPMLGPVGLENAEKALTGLQESRKTQMVQLQKQRKDWDELVTKADVLGVDEITSKVESDKAKFEVDA